MARACVFCGSTDLSGEHVMPKWLSTIGFDLRPRLYEVGPLNRIPKRWTSTPFTMTVKVVCKACNSGWMAQLEEMAKDVLTPLVVGAPMRLDADHQTVIASWSHKTALTAMLASSDLKA